MNYNNYNQTQTQWKPRPLNRKGDLAGWKNRMRAKCPNPIQGQVVWLDKEHIDRFTGVKTFSAIGYKVIGFNSQGEAIWQRGQEVYH